VQLTISYRQLNTISITLAVKYVVGKFINNIISILYINYIISIRYVEQR